MNNLMKAIHLLKNNFYQTENRLDKLVLAFILLFILSSNYSIAISQITYFTALALWLAKMLYEKKWNLKSTPYDWYFLAFIGAELISTVLSHDPMQSLYYLHKRVVIIPIIYLMAVWLNSRDRLTIGVVMLIFGAFVLSIYGVVKVFVYFDEFIHYKRRLDLFQFSMTTSELFMIAAALVLPFILHKNTPKNYRILAISALIPILFSFLFTFQRGPWVGFFFAVLVLTLKRSKLFIYIIIGLAILIIIISPAELQNRVFSIFDPSEGANQHRLNQWQTGWRIFLDNPIFGVGDIGTEEFFPKYGKPGESVWGHLHSNIITIGVKLGTVGLFIFLVLFIKIFLVFWEMVNKHKDDWLINSTALGGVASLVAFHVSGLFEFSFGDTEVIMYLWIVCGFATAAKFISDKENNLK